MFEGLDNIDWKNLIHEDVALWLRGLASEDETVRHGAYDSLYDSHMFDGTIHYLGTPHIVPFLIELLDANETQEKDSILLMLMQLADAATSAKRHNRNVVLADQLYNNISKGCDLYKRHLGVSDRITRENAKQLLSYFEKLNSQDNTSS